MTALARRRRVRGLSMLAYGAASYLLAADSEEERVLLREHFAAVLEESVEQGDRERRAAAALRAGLEAIEAGEDVFGACLAVGRAERQTA